MFMNAWMDKENVQIYGYQRGLKEGELELGIWD